MRNIAKYSGVAVLLISVVMLAGCVTGGAKGAEVNIVDTELTLEGAKKAAMAMEREIAAMGPGRHRHFHRSTPEWCLTQL